MQFQVASRTDIGLRRKINEDALIDRSAIGLWAVADGMGGHEAGDIASAKVVEHLGAVPQGATAGETADAAIAALQQANEELIAYAHARSSQTTIGSTVVGLAIAQGEYRCFWAGDSRAFRVRDRQIEQLMQDHSLVNDLVKARLLAPEDAATHPDANVITRAIGAKEEIEIDCNSGDVKLGDLFLLASDGVTRVLSDEEILHELITKNPMQAADSMVEMVLARGAPDNLTLIIVRVV